MAEKGLFLGLIENLTTAGDIEVTLKPKSQWLDRLVTLLQGSISSGKLVVGMARPIQGKLLHLSLACEGRVARGQVYAFKESVELNRKEWSDELKANLEFHVALSELKPWENRFSDKTGRSLHHNLR